MLSACLTQRSKFCVFIVLSEGKLYFKFLFYLGKNVCLLSLSYLTVQVNNNSFLDFKQIKFQCKYT